MAVDPSELVKKNVPLIVIYVLAVVPVIGWFVVVGGGVKGGKKDSFAAESKKLKSSKRKIEDMIKRIKNPDETVYTDKDRAKFEEQHKVYAELIGELKETLKARDNALEAWFETYKDLPKGKLPKANDYITLYEKKILELTQTYGDLVGASDGQPKVYTQPPSSARGELKLFQKRYWIQKYVLESLLKGGEAGTKLGTPTRVVQAIRFADPSDTEQGGESMVQRHDVNIVFTCSPRDLPVIVEKLLSQPISMQIRALRMQKEPFVYDEPEISVHVDGRGGYFQDVFYTGELKDQAAYKARGGDAGQEKFIPEPPVRVTVDLQVLDFEIPEPKAPEPAPEGE